MLPHQPIAPPELTSYTPPGPVTLRERIGAFVRFYWFLGVILLALLLFGVLLIFASRESAAPVSLQDLDPRVLSEVEPAESPAQEVILSVSTFPYGATVLLDLDSVGTAPVSSLSVVPGLYLLSVRLDGHTPIDTLVQLSGQAARRFYFPLQPAGTGPDAIAAATPNSENARRTTPAPLARETTAPARNRGAAGQRNQPPVARQPEPVPGSLTLTTEPPGATAVLNGRHVGQTPVTERNLPPGQYEVSFSLSGYELITRMLTVRENEAANHGTTLVRSEGTLSVLVRPWGSIYINGALHKRDSDVQYRVNLPVGVHVVRAVHPSLGEIERQVEVLRATETGLVLEFLTD